jgi:hypothetical protein
VPHLSIPLTKAGNSYSLSFDGASEARFTTEKPFIFHEGNADATLEFWINAPDQIHNSIFWTNGNGADNNRFNIFIDQGGIIGGDYRSNNREFHVVVPRDGSVRILLDKWTHVAITRKLLGEGVHRYQSYVDGLLKATTFDPNPHLPNAPVWTLAGRPGPRRFVGLIDELRSSDRALTPSEFLNALPSARQE